MLKLLTFLVLTNLIFSCAHRNTKVLPIKSLVDFSKMSPEVESESSFFSNDLFFKATDASIRGDSELAVKLYEKLLSLDKNKDLSHVKRRYAVELIRTGRISQSQTILENLLKKVSFKDEALGLLLGGVYSTLNQSVEAESTYRKILKNYPKSEEACVFLAKSYGLKKFFKKATRLLSKCETGIKKKGIFSYYKGKISFHQKKWKRGLSYFKKSLKLEPSYEQSALAMGLYYESVDKPLKAFGIYKKFLSSNKMSQPVLNQATQLMFTHNIKEDLVDYVERLSTLDPEDLNTKTKLGILYADQNKVEDAKGIFKEILTVVPDSDKILYYLGALCQKTDEPNEAIRFFSKIDETSELFSDSSLQVAYILRDMALAGASDKETELNKFIQKFDKHKKIQFELKTILTQYYENKGLFKKAAKIFSKLKNEKSFEDSHLYYLASLYEKDQNHKESRKMIFNKLTTNPNDAYALNFLGYSYLEVGDDLDLAYKYISKAVESDPKDGYIRDSLGWYYFKIGELKKALKEIELAASLVSDDSTIIKHLGIVHRELNNYSEATKVFKEALRYTQNQNEKDEIFIELQKIDSERVPASK